MSITEQNPHYVAGICFDITFIILKPPTDFWTSAGLKLDKTALVVKLFNQLEYMVTILFVTNGCKASIIFLKNNSENHYNLL